MTKQIGKKAVFTADEVDFIHSEDVKEAYGIGFKQQRIFLDAGKLTAYQRSVPKAREVWPNEEPEKWEDITGDRIPDEIKKGLSS